MTSSKHFTQLSRAQALSGKLKVNLTAGHTANFFHRDLFEKCSEQKEKQKKGSLRPPGAEILVSNKKPVKPPACRFLLHFRSLKSARPSLDVSEEVEIMACLIASGF